MAAVKRLPVHYHSAGYILLAGVRIFSGMAEFSGFDDFLEKLKFLIMTQAFEIWYFVEGG